MSNIINIENYEAFWIDYLDGKLSESEEEILFDFLENNHHIASGLIDSEAYKLPKFDVMFPEKDKLFSRNQTENMLIAKIENVISSEDDKFITEKIINNTDIAEDFELYKKTILIPDQDIVYPFKKNLYKSGKKVAFRYISYVAAALILLIGISGFFILNRFIDKPEFEKELFVDDNSENIDNSEKESIYNYNDHEQEQVPEKIINIDEEIHDLKYQNGADIPINPDFIEHSIEKLPVKSVEPVANAANANVMMDYRMDFPDNENLYSYTIEVKRYEMNDEESEKTKLKDKFKNTVRKLARFRQDFDIKETYEKIRDYRDDFLTTNE
jgi:hypothetical protein